MSDLTEFLLARIEEDEEGARSADPGPWRSWIEGRDGSGGDDVILTEDADLYVAVVKQTDRIYNRNYAANQDHIARWDPARRSLTHDLPLGCG